jgi:acyl-CoA dehydrogenase
MILAIWEGTAHRQMLDALEVIERKNAHRMLLAYVEQGSQSSELRTAVSSIDEHLRLSAGQREAEWEPIAANLAKATANALCKQLHR